MKSLRRYDYNNRLYFITCVTHNRQKILLDDVDLFWKSWKNSSLLAWVILPDHFHVIINSKQVGISNIIHTFKRTYT